MTLPADILSPLARTLLSGAGWGEARAVPLSGDASFRAYVRLHLDGRTALLMLAPVDKEAIEPFIAVGKYLQSLDISVPDILAADPQAGFALLEDLGDAVFSVAIADGADEYALYAGATDVLVHVHAAPCPEMLHGFAADHPLQHFTPERLQDEVDRVLEWHWDDIHGRPVSASIRADYHAAWAPLWAVLATRPLVLTQCDYHSPNLMWLPGRTGLRRIGVLDFQDALQGPASYDLVSLLQDARRDVRPDIEPALRRRYLAARPELDPAEFAREYAIMGAQRAARLVGQFIRLWRRDGKPGYLQHQPRIWRYLDEALRHPDLAAVRQWFDAHVPMDRRGAYWLQQLAQLG